MKAVLDTNVYISEALFDRLAEAVVRAGRERAFSIYISDWILDEIYRVLVNRFHVTRRFALLTVERARRFSRPVLIRGRAFKGLVDSDDHPILETAVNCGADFLVTGDDHLLRLSPYQGIEVVRVGAFYRSLVEGGTLPKDAR